MKWNTDELISSSTSRDLFAWVSLLAIVLVNMFSLDITRYPCIHIANVIVSGSTLYLKMLGDVKYG